MELVLKYAKSKIADRPARSEGQVGQGTQLLSNHTLQFLDSNPSIPPLDGVSILREIWFAAEQFSPFLNGLIKWEMLKSVQRIQKDK
jgi:hypothetical protein